MALDKTLFLPTPSKLIFNNYEPNQIYELTLTLRNMDSVCWVLYNGLNKKNTHFQVPRSVHLTHNDSPYFDIKNHEHRNHKVASGLSVTFTIQFKPDGRRDYCHELLCITDRELFSIPVFCIGPRAKLSIPKEIDFGLQAIRYPTIRTVCLHNVGDVVANINMETERYCFMSVLIWCFQTLYRWTNIMYHCTGWKFSAQN